MLETRRLAAGAVQIVGMDDVRGTGWRPDRESEQTAPGACARPIHASAQTQARRRKESLGFLPALSGHTHRGQLFPFSLITRLFFPFHAGAYVLPGGGMLYVSRGTGTWGPPIRLGAPPEVTVIDLVRAAPAAPRAAGPS